MAEVKYLADINLSKNQLTNVKLQHIAGNPSGTDEAYEGRTFYDSTNKVVKFHNGTDFISLSAATGDLTGITAGVGLSGSSLTGPVPTLTVDFSEFSTVTPANGDFFATLDSDGSTEQKTSIAALATLLAGSGLTATNSVIAVDTLNQNTTGTADKATHVLVSNNESANEENEITFVEDAAAGGAQRGLESSAKATFNPSTGKITATGFVGALTGNASGNAATVTTNANLTGHITSSGNAAVLGSFTVAQLSAALSNASISGNNTGDQTNISGNAATVTTNANLTGHITSSGNAAVLGSFTVAQLSAALSNASISGNNTGDQTSVSGSSGTVTSIGNLTGEVTSTNRATVISGNVVDEANLKVSNDPSNGYYLTAQSGNTGGMTWAALPAVDNVSVSKLKTALAGNFGGAVTIGDSNDLVTIGQDLTVTGDLIVSGDTVTVNTATLDVEDLNITVGKAATSSSATNGAGLTFGAWSSGTIPTFTWDHSNTRFAMNKSLAANIVGNVTGDVTGDVSGNAGTVTTNANLTGHITSSGNAAVLGSFTVAQLSAALSNASISGNNTGDQTSVSGSSGTVTSIGNLTGDVTSTNRATTIGSNKVTTAKINAAAVTTAKVADAAVTLAKQANLAQSTIIGRAAGAGTGVPTALSASQIRTLINVSDDAKGDQSKSDIDALAITTVGAIDTGTWASTDIAVAHGGTGASSASAARTNLGVAYADDAATLAASSSTTVVTPAGLKARSFKGTYGGATTANVDHGLNTRDVIVQLYDSTSFETVHAQVVRTSASRVTLTFNVAPGSNDVTALVTKID